MAERKFNYQAVQGKYSNMKNHFTAIKELFENTDKYMHDELNVSEEAVFGPVGAQLLGDWENTSSNFPSFSDNFNNWAALIAQASENYSEFEEKVKGLEKANSLGMGFEGRKNNYVAKSDYSKYKKKTYDDYKKALENVKDIQAAKTNAYITTDSESILRKHQITTGIVAGLDVAGVAISGIAAYPSENLLFVSSLLQQLAQEQN